jgi:hypothetical protein
MEADLMTITKYTAAKVMALQNALAVERYGFALADSLLANTCTYAGFTSSEDRNEVFRMRDEMLVLGVTEIGEIS